MNITSIELNDSRIIGKNSEHFNYKPERQYLLIVLLIFVCFNRAISQGKPETLKKISILAWNGIPASEATLGRYEELEESGITYNFTSFPDVEAASKALRIAEKTGIKMIVSCPELKTDTKKTVRRFMNNPTIAGYYLQDESNSGDFSELGKWVKKIHAIDKKHFCYIIL